MRQVLNPLGMTEEWMNKNEALHELRPNDCDYVEDEYELWDALHIIQNYITEFGASNLVSNMTNESYEPLVAVFNRDFDLMKLRVASCALQVEAVCKDSYQ